MPRKLNAYRVCKNLQGDRDFILHLELPPCDDRPKFYTIVTCDFVINKVIICSMSLYTLHIYSMSLPEYCFILKAQIIQRTLSVCKR